MSETSLNIEPCKLTCPDIDKLIGQLEEQVKVLRSILRNNRDIDKDVAYDIDRAADAIEETYYKGRWGKETAIIELLRENNSELRHWGLSLVEERQDISKFLETLLLNDSAPEIRNKLIQEYIDLLTS